MVYTEVKEITFMREGGYCWRDCIMHTHKLQPLYHITRKCMWLHRFDLNVSRACLAYLAVKGWGGRRWADFIIMLKIYTEHLRGKIGPWQGCNKVQFRNIVKHASIVSVYCTVTSYLWKIGYVLEDTKTELIFSQFTIIWAILTVYVYMNIGDLICVLISVHLKTWSERWPWHFIWRYFCRFMQVVYYVLCHGIIFSLGWSWTIRTKRKQRFSRKFCELQTLFCGIRTMKNIWVCVLLYGFVINQGIVPF